MKPPSCKKSGFMQVALVVFLGLFLTFSALALDLGNLYLWRLRAQKAAHAAAVAGLGYRVNNGYTTTITPAGTQALYGIVRQTVDANFTIYGARNQPTTTPNYNPATDTVTVSIAYDAPTFLVGRLNNFFNFGLRRDSTTIALNGIQSIAQLNPATIVLLLDVSGSMTGRIDSLIAGATEFVKQFNPGRDRISVIPFNIGAHTQYPLQATGFSAGILPYLQSLNGNTRSNTNHCDALTEAIAALNSYQATSRITAREIRPSVVLFTDGAPNAMRATFSQVHPKGVSDGPRDQDAYLYAVEWYDGSTATPYVYRGPGPVVFRPNIPSNVINPMFGFQIQTNQVAPSTWSFYPQNFPTDFANVSNPRLFRQVLDRSQSGNGCLQNLDFFITGTNEQAQVRGVPFESANTTKPDDHWPPRFFKGVPPGTNYNYQYFDQLPYYCAIEAADYIRKTFAGTVYTIGLGVPNMLSSPDPFQDADLSDSNNPLRTQDNPRKDFFLARLAFSGQSVASVTAWADRYDFSTQRTLAVNATNSPDHRYSQAQSPPLAIGNTSSTFNPDSLRPSIPNDGSNGRRYDTQGEYFPTERPEDLPEIYRRIARTILLRSVQ